MDGRHTLFIFVMVALAIVLAGTFVLRPSLSAVSTHDRHTFYLVVRLGIVLFGLMYGSHHSWQHRSTDYSSDSTSPSSSGAGPKIMEFNWSTTQRSQ